MDPVEAVPGELPFARLLSEEVGWSNTTTPNVRVLRFEDSEYGMPLERGLACFRDVRRRVKERWRHLVGWCVLYRTMAADDAYLSPATGRPAAISLHQNTTLPHREYFADIEGLFRAHGGRPHWARSTRCRPRTYGRFTPIGTGSWRSAGASTPTASS